MILTCFLSFSRQNHAESLGNHPKKSFLDPKCNIFMKKSRHSDMSGPAKASPGGMSGPVWTCLDLLGPVWTSPGGQVLTANQRKYFFSQKLQLSFFYEQIYHFSIKMYHFQSKTVIRRRIFERNWNEIGTKPERHFGKP